MLIIEVFEKLRKSTLNIDEFQNSRKLTQILGS